MTITREAVGLHSGSEILSGTLFLPEKSQPTPALIVCHGAGEFKENYYELCGMLAERGIATLAIDMHGHGESSGERYHVNMREWIADVRAGIDFLVTHPRVDERRIGAFGLSSGGTAILEAAIDEPRLKALVALGATVRNALPWSQSLPLKMLVALGKIKKQLTKSDLRVPLLKLSNGMRMAADPEVDRKLQSDPRLVEAFMTFPFPGGAEAFFVDTLKRVSRISAPTLVLWGAEDKVDPPETAELLYEALNCQKQLHIIPGNGHVGHMDRNKGAVFALTADWALRTLL